MSQSPRSHHGGYTLDLPKYSSQDTLSDDQDKLGLSFFNWANVVGKRPCRNNEEIEEVNLKFNYTHLTQYSMTE